MRAQGPVIPGDQGGGRPAQMEHAPVEVEQRCRVVFLAGDVDPGRVVGIDREPGCDAGRAEAGIRRIAPLQWTAAAIARLCEREGQGLRGCRSGLFDHRVILGDGRGVSHLPDTGECKIGHADFLAIVEEGRALECEHQCQVQPRQGRVVLCPIAPPAPDARGVVIAQGVARPCTGGQHREALRLVGVDVRRRQSRWAHERKVEDEM